MVVKNIRTKLSNRIILLTFIALFFSFNLIIIILLNIQFIYYKIGISNSSEMEFTSANILINYLTVIMSKIIYLCPTKTANYNYFHIFFSSTNYI